VAHVALVGKGITYDSGGITLKPAAGLTTMKCDMGGAAAVVAATLAIARLGLPVRVSAYAALAENMPSGTATRPGDVLRMRNGTTVEVLNTDAEGRLVLADALVLADEANPDLLIDVATLTGAAMVALGTRTAALITEDRALSDALHGAGDRAGDPLWPLPIPEEMRAKVRSSHIADLRQHNPDTSGGALFAAAFLREFVGERRWAHLDVAGPAFNAGEPFGYTPRGGTGTGVRALVRLAEDLADGVTV
jgi:leucyl aminopeptidase